MNIKVEIQNTTQEIQDAYIAHIGGGKLRPFIVGGIMIFISLYFLITQHEASDIYFWFFPLLTGVYLIYRMLNYGKRLIRMNPRLLDKAQVEINDEGLFVQKQNEDVRLKWSAFVKVKVTDNVVLLYTDQLRFFFFFRNSFSENDFAELKQKALQLSTQTYRDK
jgi:hypothetical protein